MAWEIVSDRAAALFVTSPGEKGDRKLVAVLSSAFLSFFLFLYTEVLMARALPIIFPTIP